MAMRTAAAAAIVGLVLAGCQAGEQRSSSTEASAAPSSSAPSSTSRPDNKPTPRDTEDARLARLDQRTLDTRLIAAAWANDVGRAQELIDAGADVNAKDDTEQSAYLIATSEGHLPMLDLTLRHGANVRSLDSYHGTGLIRAADRGHADIVARLLETEIEVNHVNELGWTALLEAVVLGDGSPRYQRTVRLLLDGGADAAIADNDGVTPLEHAEASGYDEIASILRRASR